MTIPMSVQASFSQVEARVASVESRFGVRRGQVLGAASSSGVDFASVLGAAGSTRTSFGAKGSSVSKAQLEAAVQEYVGIPYVWGGTDPATGLDCSGFTQHLMRRFGVELPRVSVDQLRTGTPVAYLASAQPGDLIGWDNSSRNNGADHVAVYLGDGMMAEAPGTGGKVQVVPVTKTPDLIRRVLPEASALTSVSQLGGTLSASAVGVNPSTPYADLFTSAGARHGVDPKLLALVAERESGFNPKAVSPAGAQGLMQLMPGTARGLGVGNPFDPAQAVDGAARLLRGHLDSFGTVEKALAAYNAGPGNVQKHGGVPPFAETRRYVQWIGARYGGNGRWT